MAVFTFFGATGGCALAALTRTLKANIDAVALVRSPEKLLKLLAEHSVSESAISSHLTLITGDAKDVASVKKALVRPKDASQLTDVIISAVGSYPKLGGFSISKPITLHDPTLCETAARALVQAVRELQQAGVRGRPMVVAISTTGVSSRVRDVPILYAPLYHWLLAVPHKDKRAMEDIFNEAAGQGSEGAFRGFLCLRPTLLGDGKGKGAEKLRVGWEGGEAEGHGPALGYTITRDDVGDWLFEKIVKAEGREHWAGRMVTLTT